MAGFSSIVRINEGLALLIAAIVVALVFGSGELFSGNIAVFMIVSLAAIIAVIPHELMHRWSARRFGCFSRYVLEPTGLFLTLITAIPFIPFKIIMPGFVLVSCPLLEGSDYKRVNGVVSLAGPVTNIFISVASLLLLKTIMYVSSSIMFAILLFYSYKLNAWVAFFNLLPIPPLDGSKIIRWKPVLWGIAIALSIILFFVF